MRRLKEFLLSITFIVLWTLILWGLVLLIVPPILRNYLSNKAYPHSYIQSINMPGYGLDKTKKYLDYFNELGDNKIIRYNKDLRPITIVEKVLEPNYLGLSYINYDYCHVYITPGLIDEAFRDVLIHELVHCFGFPHVAQSQKDDLMTPAYVGPASLESLKYYAQEIKKIYEHRRWYE
jgi:hypothetical protein